MLPTTIDEVINQLDEIIADSIAAHDRCGYFPALYRRVTIEIKQKINEHYFDDNERMEKLDVAFANRYIDAWNKSRGHSECSRSWQLTFEAAKHWSPLVIQHLFLGMNAHISFDLGIAAATISTQETIHELRADFFKINGILSSLVDEVQIELGKIWLLLIPLDWMAGRLDEKIAKFAMGIARDAAWQVALDFIALTSVKDQQNYLRERDAKVFNFGQKLYKPGMVFQLLSLLFRITETGTIRSKIKRLNGK